MSEPSLEEKTEDKELPSEKKKKKIYIDNAYFEKLILSYREDRDEKKLSELHEIFKNIIERVYSIAVRNIYNNVGGLFPAPNSHDKEDLMANAFYWCFRAIDYWSDGHKEGKKKSKAFNYFTCCIVYSIQNDLKKELRKGWYKSDVFMKDFTTRYILKTGIQIYRDYDNFVENTSNY